MATTVGGPDRPLWKAAASLHPACLPGVRAWRWSSTSPPSLCEGASRSDLKMQTPCRALAPLPVSVFKLAWHVSLGDTAQVSFWPSALVLLVRMFLLVYIFYWK